MNDNSKKKPTVCHQNENETEQSQNKRQLDMIVNLGTIAAVLFLSLFRHMICALSLTYWL